jgi:hypothetical protein
MNAVVVGGHTRNIGKTSVISSLIREFAPLGWTAVKITQYGHGICSRDGHPCGCAPKEHPFALTEETDARGRADTCRFLAAGARQSLWLRVRQGQIPSALPLLWQKLRHAECVVIESNSIVEYLDPLLYLVVLDTSQQDFKSSARRALGRADALVFVAGSGTRVDGCRWPDLDPGLLGSRPTFHVPKPSFWNRALGDFMGKRLATTEAARSSLTSRGTGVPLV